ncbi:flavodoxin domain-containing protein [Niallia oryzisoli]|uniref:Flavodoxin domain-containing protein n=1 Tax=Niallia oryzisoli TaxID=1737571 RepID=A0ABZ2CB82_9BACI
MTGKKAAAFGSGCSTYEHFASAVDILEEALRKQGCAIITEGLKADTWSKKEADIETNCISFAKKIIAMSQPAVFNIYK